MARNPILLAMLLVAPVAGIRPRSNASRTSSRLPGMSLATLPMHMYRQDCWQRHPVAFMAAKRAGVETHSAGKAARKAALPGAGLGEIVPFETVLKDGYYPVDCLADYMFTHGDKFGDTADEYELASVSNVSIVHYSAVVPREDVPRRLLCLLPYRPGDALLWNQEWLRLLLRALLQAHG